MCLLVPSLSWNWDALLIHKTVSKKILKTSNKCEDNLLKIDNNKFIKCEVSNITISQNLSQNEEPYK